MTVFFLYLVISFLQLRKIIEDMKMTKEARRSFIMEVRI